MHRCYCWIWAHLKRTCSTDDGWCRWLHRCGQQNTYVPLGMWIYKAVGAKYSYRSRFVATNIGVQITNGINNAMGRHTRSSWFVDKDRQPLISTLAVPIDGVTFHIKPGRKMCVKYSAEVITKLGQMALADKQGKLLAEEKQRKTTVRHDLTSYAMAALDETDLMHLKKSKIKWQPSKLRFLVGTGRTATAHSTNLSKRVRNKCKGNPDALKNKLIAKVLRVKDKLCGDYSTDTDDESVDDATDNGSDDSGTPSNEWAGQIVCTCQGIQSSWCMLDCLEAWHTEMHIGERSELHTLKNMCNRHTMWTCSIVMHANIYQQLP